VLDRDVLRAVGGLALAFCSWLGVPLDCGFKVVIGFLVLEITETLGRAALFMVCSLFLVIMGFILFTVLALL